MTLRGVKSGSGLANGGRHGGKPRTISRVYPLPTQIYGPWTPQQTIDFVGSLTDGTKSTFFSFNVLAGASAPTITGGWAKITTIDRPQTLGYTVPQGYDPVTMDVPIQFEAVGIAPTAFQDPTSYQVNSAGRIKLGKNIAGNDVEGDIQKLHWDGRPRQAVRYQSGQRGRSRCDGRPAACHCRLIRRERQRNGSDP